ncbi:sigma-70 family RNA polymerase sigma factor [Bacteroides cellulosilyticus]|uniref:sigma-70 family RNA polymerase sigma factor n=1 Tax=Bacteroides cellulosilyticus TaxID=246787 RepID=UPI00189E0EC9|nr:sigma-70 family RNA polymerase sigma factor [Bacteroides cellulosilyticus]
MKNAAVLSNQVIADAYTGCYDLIFRYIYNKINNRERAEDLTQDTFLRLLSYRDMFYLNIDTIKYFVYTIARNLVTDYLRRYYKEQEINAYLLETVGTSVDDVENKLYAKELSWLEQEKLSRLPSQRRKVYAMNRFQYKTAFEISTELHISPRTVENHLLISRKEIRTYIKQSI